MSQTTTTQAPDTRTGIHTPGVFVWHELHTQDVAKSQAFYSSLFGWSFAHAAMPGMDYHMIQIGEKQIGGMCALDNKDVPPHWAGYISVPNVDKAIETAKTAGGGVIVEAMDIPTVGRFAVIADPQGAAASLFTHVDGDPVGHETGAGEFCWDQLITSDVQAGAAFYEKVVGWTTAWPAPGMGLFKMGDLHEASIMEAPQGVPPHWLTFIEVTDLAAAQQKAEGLGAKTMMANLPAGEWGQFTVIQDPSGTFLALFAANKG